MPTMHLEGLEDLLLNFDRIDTALRSKDIEQAFQLGGEVIAEAARQLAPVSPPYPWTTPGELRDSIYVRAYTRDGNVYVIIGTRNVRYAAFVEFGTERNAAEPFMRPALAQSQGAVEDAVAKAIADLIAL